MYMKRKNQVSHLRLRLLLALIESSGQCMVDVGWLDRVIGEN
jgi:hypothetical protein